MAKKKSFTFFKVPAESEVIAEPLKTKEVKQITQEEPIIEKPPKIVVEKTPKKPAKKPAKRKPRKTETQLKQEFKEGVAKLDRKQPKQNKIKKLSKAKTISEIIKILSRNKDRDSPLSHDSLRGKLLDLKLEELKPEIKRLKTIANKLQLTE